MLTGRPVFEAASDFQLNSLHIGAPVPPMATRVPTGLDVPGRVEELVLGLLEKSPDSRPDSARAASEQIGQLLDGAHRVQRAGTGDQKRRRVWPFILLGMAGLLAAAGGIVVWLLLSR